jgi:soluble lytic murein transglycosylase-like protein
MPERKRGFCAIIDPVKLSLSQLQQLAVSVGFPDPALAAAVAMAESGGNPNAYGDPQYGGSIGLWQINLRAHPEYDPQKLYVPKYNAQAAYAISSGGTNWRPWTTFRNGAYRQWYHPSSSAPLNRFRARTALLAGAAAVSVATLVFLALEEAGSPGTVLPWRERMV